MECGVVEEHYETLYFYPQHQHSLPWNDPAKNSVGPGQAPPHQCRMFLLLLT